MIEPGTVIGGRYRLTRQVGEGGMATVWEAEHLTLAVRVAVKLMSVVGPHIAELTERFMNEARGAASVRHRNVVEIIDFGLFDGRTPYMVMELLEGESLADRLGRDGDVPAREAIFIVSHVLRGLTSVHEAGMVHRDLKPENIFLTSDSEEGTFPKLIDFGVSKGVGRSDLTHEGALVGTPDYMSPEQARGRRDIDLRTDIYSMGVILYELLTGRLPFEAENLGDLIVLICGGDAPLLSKLRPDLPTKLSEVIHRAMAKDREERFEDARAMREALNEVAEDLGFSASGSQLISLADFPLDEEPVPVVRVRARPNRRSSRKNLDAIDMASTLPAGASDPSITPSHPQPLGALPALPRESTTTGQHPAKRPTRTRPWLLVLLLLTVVGAVTAWRLWPQLPGPTETPTEAVGLKPWTPSSGSVPEVLEPAPNEEEAEIRVAVRGIPAGAYLRVDRIRIAGSQVILPYRRRRYRIEVADEEGSVSFRIDHPGRVNGSYEWHPQNDAKRSTKRRNRRRR